MWQLSPKAEEIRRREQAAINERLKAQKRDPITDYELDLRLFGTAPFGHVVKHEFLIRCWNHESGDADVLEVDGVQNYWHVRMARALCRFKRVIFLGCASSGKTHRSAAYGKTLWKSRPFGTSVYLSTTSAEAGEARTWGTVKDLFNVDKYRIGKIINSLRVITLDEETRGEDGEKERDYRNGIRAVLIKAGAEGKNVVGSICGRKNDQVVWICDELNFLDPGVLDARVNLFSNDFAQFVGIGNAPTEGSPLYTDAEPFGEKFPDGWRSVDKDVHEGWPTRTGYCLYFNGEKSPNMQVPRGQKPRFKKLMDWAKRDEILATAGGEDTPVFYTQFYGFPPTVDIPDKILTWKLMHSNGAFEQPLWDGSPVKVLAGLDLGFREGGDPCVICFSRIGRDTRGKTIAAFEKDGIPLLPSQKSKEAFEQQIAGMVIKSCRERECHNLALDVSGDGGLLLQAIERKAREENYKLEVLPVSFSGVADDSVRVIGSQQKATQVYDRRVSQLWAGVRLAVQNGVIRGMNEHSKVVRELCGRKFSTDEKKRWSIEKKSEYAKRLKHSPDYADSACLNIFLAFKHGLSGESASAAVVAAMRKEERAAAVPRYSAGHGSRVLYGGR